MDKSIPEAVWRAAVDIFAFDALIQNPDRRFNNPNLFTRGDSLFVFDHEAAFSFLIALFPSATPWKLEDQQYLTNHVFYRKLKSKQIDLTGFTASLSRLSDGLLDEIVAEIPAEWNNDNLARIKQHLEAVRNRAAEFAEGVQRILV
ncbi:MAG TPA: HipA family kinase [Bryobacteraceae bacterium]|nr:HipA family kinase [Bryobacteraceae bacterium]